MTERYRRSSGAGLAYVNLAKMENEFTPKKTMLIMVIVVACFAVLWPRIFYPMLYGSVNQQIKPSAIDKTTGCCYVLSETDVDAIKIMSELCGKIIKEQMGEAPLTSRQIINVCQDEVYRTCGIDVSAVLHEQVRLGHTTKQILDEIRSMNGSLCLKYNFGVQPWRLGVPHMITLKNISESVRQERSPLVRSEMVHPAFRERGRAIPQAKPTRPQRIIEGKPGPIPGMRPTLGGPGHVVPPSKQGSGSMGIIMPIYTIGIVIFFTYTLMKIICKKHPDTDTIYSKMDLDTRYTKEGLTENGSRGSRDTGSCKLVVNAMSALLEEVDQEIEARRKSSEVAQDERANLSNGSVKNDEKSSVKIMGMETTESCEGGKKWQSANSAVVPSTPQPVNEYINPPQEIYLDRILPSQSQILVSDSATETEKNASDDDSPIVLAGKMTLSVISLENEELEIDDIVKVKSNNTEETIHQNKPIIKKEINCIIEEAIESINHNENNDITIEDVTEEKIKETSSEVDVIVSTVDVPISVTSELSLMKNESKGGTLLSTNIVEKDEEKEHFIGIKIIEQKDLPQNEGVEETFQEDKAQERNSFGEKKIDAEKNVEYDTCGMQNVEQQSDSEEVAEETLYDIDFIQKTDIPKEIANSSIRLDIVQTEIDTEEVKTSSSDIESKLVRQDKNENEMKSTSTNIGNTINEIESHEDVKNDNEEISLQETEIASPSSCDSKESLNLINIQKISSGHTNKKDAHLESDFSEEMGKIPSLSILNLNTKSSSEDSGSTILSDSNQGSIINVNMTQVENENREEEDEISEEESDVQYEEEEIEISEEEIDENDVEIESPRVQLAEIQNQNAIVGLVNGTVTHNGSTEEEESEEEEVEEIIEEYSDDDDDGNWEVNSD